MKLTADNTATAAAAAVLSRSAEVSRVTDWTELVKIRLSGLVLLTTMSGFHLASRGPIDLVLLFHTLCGTAMLAFGASALNQFQERLPDSRMRRTAHRPLPAGRMTPDTALWFGLISSAMGVLYLALAVNVLTSALGALTVLIYNLVYTPLKRVTWHNTIVGAVPGALPPVMGWTAARDALDSEAWMLFVVLFFWQIPHFMAIAWLYRDDYARGGFVMLPQIDDDGRRTGRQAVAHSAALLVASVLPVAAGLAGTLYLAVSLALGLLMLAVAQRFRRNLTLLTARRLFLASIVYLPLLLVVLALNKARE